MIDKTDLLTESQVREQATWLEINQSALRHNLAQIVSLALPSATIMAVVKANAYGHGLFEIAKLLRDRVTYLGVASIEEALALRRFEIDVPILLFGIPSKDALEAAIQSEISLAVSSLEQARQISQVARQWEKPAIVHIKVDTGMGRLGIPQSEALQVISEIASLEMLELEGIFTHFPQGEDEKDPFTQNQIRSFHQIVQKASAKGIHFAYRHAANSIGIANHRDSHFNLVRPGLALYGLYPASSLIPKLALKPVLSWHARIILIKRLAPGQSAGYGRTFVAQEETTIGVIPVGYSHGYPFALSNKGFVLYEGNRYPVAGRVSMDYIAVNFGPQAPGVQTGDIVTLLGKNASDEISGETLAELAHTIPYEILTQLSPFLPRILR
ncbi:MAG: alanine racemase [Candidatus Omnitrophica bacterium]|nr:alanine racemase [Candidatus Omnitrophota bacterium]